MVGRIDCEIFWNGSSNKIKYICMFINEMFILKLVYMCIDLVMVNNFI